MALPKVTMDIFLNIVLSCLVSAIAVRDKLESLCRELQRQNKILMVRIRFTLSSLLNMDLAKHSLPGEKLGFRTLQFILVLSLFSHPS